jgi:ribosomal protein S18 acetylase RimI-like enzyme
MALDGLRFDLSDGADAAARDYIHQQIKAHNDAVSEHHRALRPVGPSPLDVFARDGDGKIVGGLVADVYWGWLAIEDLWIAPSLRGQGHGQKLMGMAEAEAVARGCTRSFVQTFSFQARGFYEKLGFHVVGRLDDYPPGQAFYWMRKDLSPTEMCGDRPLAG